MLIEARHGMSGGGATISSDNAARPDLYTSKISDVNSLRETAADYKNAFPWADEESIEINLAVHACYWAIKEAETKLYLSLGLGRTAGRFTVLRAIFLSSGRRLTQNEVAAKLNITSATVTFLVDGLQKDGLVDRLTNEADRRSVHVELTEKGLQVCERLIPEMAHMAAAFSEGLSAEEKETLLGLLLRFRQNASNFEFEGAS
ncbi:MAG: MarR family winged helix-turn-helix transcriptional regulator [Dehalococcoidia bacterium]